MEYKDFSTPHRLMGCTFYASEFPCFAVPIFQNLETDSLVTQVVGETNIIFDFSPINFEISSENNVPDLIVRSGSQSVVSFALTSDNVIYSTQEEFNARVVDYLNSDMLQESPFFARDLARSIHDYEIVRKINYKLYNETLSNFPKSQRFFLENNIVREFIVDRVPEDVRHHYRNLKINVKNNQVIIDSENLDLFDAHFKFQLSSELQALNAIKSPQIRMKDDTFEAVDHTSEANSYAFSYLNFDGNVFDCGSYLRYPSYKEAFCIFPQASQDVIQLRITKGGQLFNLEEIAQGRPALSYNTLQKIVSLSPVSLRSAQIFRFWLLHSRQRVENDHSFLMHLAIFVPVPSASDELHRFLLERNILKLEKNPGYRIAFTFSMIIKMIIDNVLSDKDVGELFAYSRRGLFDKRFFSNRFINEWIDFSEGAFKSYSPETINEIAFNTIGRSKALD